MENGQWDEANAEKLRLEEKQRTARRAREDEAVKAAAQGIIIRFLKSNFINSDILITGCD